MRNINLLIVVIIISLSTFAATEKSSVKLNKDFEIFFELMRNLDMFYVDTLKHNNMMEKGMNAMLSSLDPYTEFIPEKDLNNFNFEITGQYGGIGSVIRKIGDYVTIIEPYEGSPSQKAGLQAGDKIMEVNGDDMLKKAVEEVTKKLKGEVGVEVNLLINREDVEKPLKFKFKREQISIPSITYYGKVENTGYIMLSGFKKDCAVDMKKAFIDLKSQGISNLIIDLRSNPGGLLNEAVSICNLFLAKEKSVVSTRGKVSYFNTTYNTTEMPLDTAIPIAIMVNSNSASASEIVSGALQDYDRAIILGQKTYGKGLVQTTRDLPYNNKVKFTSAKYYIPSGRCIQVLDYTHRREDGSVGVVPDSIKRSFKTKGGRTVYDGGGISPDITIKDEFFYNITASVYTEDMIFQYAHKYFNEHKKIVSPEKYTLCDEEYQDFLKFLKEKKYKFKSNVSKSIDALKKAFESDSIKSEMVNQGFKLFEDALASYQEEQLTLRKDQIKEFIENEILSRYYYQKGRAISRLKYDDAVKEAIKIINDKPKYQAMLQPKPLEIIEEKDDKVKKFSSKKLVENLKKSCENDEMCFFEKK